MEVKERVALMIAMQGQLQRLSNDWLNCKTMELGAKNALDLLCVEFALFEGDVSLKLNAEKLQAIRNLIVNLKFEVAKLKDEWPKP